MVVKEVANESEVHAASIFRVGNIAHNHTV
jgi:hypothetical protein